MAGALAHSTSNNRKVCTYRILQDGQGGDGRPSSGGDKSSPNGELARLEAKLLTQLQAGLDCGDDCSATDGTARHVFRVDAGMPHSAPCSRHTSPLKQRPKVRRFISNEADWLCEMCDLQARFTSLQHPARA